MQSMQKMVPQERGTLLTHTLTLEHVDANGNAIKLE